MIKETISSTLNLVKQNKWIFLFITLLYITGFIVGISAPLSKQIKEYESILANDSSFIFLNPWTLFLRIFLKNLWVSFIALILGFSLVVPLLLVYVNGKILGMFSGHCLFVTNNASGSIVVFIFSILPHGIFEIPETIMASGLGLLLGLKLFFRRKIAPDINLKDLAVRIGKTFLVVILPLLLLAAFVEAFITPEIAGKAHTLIKGKKTDPALVQLILNQDEISEADRPLNINEIDAEKFPGKNLLLKNVFYWGGSIVKHNQNDIRTRLKAFEEIPHAWKAYEENDDKFHLLIIIWKFGSPEKAHDFFNITKEKEELINVILNEKNFPTVKVGKCYFRTPDNGNTLYRKSGVKGDFVYSIFFYGKDAVIFNKILELQINKLGQKNESGKKTPQTAPIPPLSEEDKKEPGIK